MRITKSIKIKALLFAIAITMIFTGGLMYYFKLAFFQQSSMINVVTAAVDIPAKSVITNIQVKETTIPKELVIKESIKSKELAIGKIAKVDIYMGEQMVSSRLGDKEPREGLATVIPEGYRAITIGVTQVTGVGGHIEKGDFIDILVYLKPPYSDKKKIKTVFQNVEVLEIGKDSNAGSGNKFLTLCMTLQDAEKLFMVEELGKVRLVLRRYEDNKITTTTETYIISLK